MPLHKNRKTILVVDDSPEMLRYFRTLLELDDCQVETADNGLDALQALREGLDPDAVILDWQMPRLSGLKTLKRLRKLRPDLKVIICSGRVDFRMQEQVAPLQVEACLAKPVDHLYLSAALDRCFYPAPKTKLAPRQPVILHFPVSRGPAGV
jgi:CheY-like chemotaxis protein